MKELLKELDKAFENKIRLCIMSALVVNEYLDFISLRDLLDVTDGNLASHLKNLEKRQYVGFKKEFLDRKPNTKYFVTDLGKAAFSKHINAIEQLLNKN
ncbi:MAG: transcriptional regulator [Bacteroidia bacterium]|nr:transcriptional regulator [Bacteroidia bacterium]